MSRTKHLEPEEQQSPAEGNPSSTRVFVSGLPPKFTGDQLAAHFRIQHQVTDAHVLGDRRIGFVGFLDAEAAQHAVKYFNKTYIRLSKISVDLAKPVEVTRDATGNAVPISNRRVRNKQDEPTDSIRKRKRTKADDGEDLRSISQIATSTAQKSVDEDPVEGPKLDLQNEQVPDETSPTDNDWLRGKTSRVLDLLEPEEAAARDTTEEPHAEHDADIRAKADLAQHQSEESGAQNASLDLNPNHVRVPNARLFVRNLAFGVSEQHLRQRFAKFGKVQEAHIVKDGRFSTSKGTAFVQFAESEEAEKALQALDGVAFQGRLLHVLPADDKRDTGLTEYDISQMPLKKQKAVRRKLAAGSATFSWNSLYMNPDAVLSSIADRLGVSKSDILDPTSSDAAIKQAHAETQLIKETKQHLASQGINTDAFKNQGRDDLALLLKNFPYGTSEDELKDILSPFGQIRKFILPPSGTMAIVQFEETYSATQALKNLAYKNIKGTVLYLERAPLGLFNANVTTSAALAQPAVSETKAENGAGLATAIFVRNLNFSTSSARLTDLAQSLPGFVSARVKTRTDAKKPGEVLSMGFGFMDFSTKEQAEAAVSALNGHSLDGHRLNVQLSTKSTDLAEEQRQKDSASKKAAIQTKIIIKNLPFQASKKDVRSLFTPYGQLKTVRVPRKFDSSTRGFAFAEFVTPREAESAMESLSNTHLLGRRLVLEFAQGDNIDPEEEIKAIEKKVEQQSNRVQLSKLLNGSGRKKFNVLDPTEEAE